MEPTLENITPLIKKEINQGASYIVHFQSPNQINPIQGYAPLAIDKNQLIKNVTKQAAKTAVKTSIISMLSRMLGRLIGGSVGTEVRYATSTVAHTVTNQSMNNTNLIKTEVTKEKRDELVLLAFKSVQNYFVWNNNTNQWDGKPENQ